MHPFQQSKRAAVSLLAIVFVFGGCTRDNQQQAGLVETVEKAGQIAAQHLLSLGRDTSFYTVRVCPDHPISWDTMTTGHHYGFWPPTDSTIFGKVMPARLSGKLFWQCIVWNKIPSTGVTQLVTDALQAWVYVETGTGEVLLTLPEDYYKSMTRSH